MPEANSEVVLNPCSKVVVGGALQHGAYHRVVRQGRILDSRSQRERRLEAREVEGHLHTRQVRDGGVAC